jgi:hypothetical protein
MLDCLGCDYFLEEEWNHINNAIAICIVFRLSKYLKVGKRILCHYSDHQNSTVTLQSFKGCIITYLVVALYASIHDNACTEVQHTLHGTLCKANIYNWNSLRTIKTHDVFGHQPTSLLRCLEI